MSTVPIAHTKDALHKKIHHMHVHLKHRHQNGNVWYQLDIRHIIVSVITFQPVAIQFLIQTLSLPQIHRVQHRHPLHLPIRQQEIHPALDGDKQVDVHHGANVNQKMI